MKVLVGLLFTTIAILIVINIKNGEEQHVRMVLYNIVQL